MAKLQDMFTQARRAKQGGGMGFLSKSKAEFKPRASALVVEFPQIEAGNAEAALKGGADGVLFNWDSEEAELLETLKQEVESAKAQNDQVVVGLNLTGGLENLDKESLERLKETGINYIILPFTAPARLLALETKDLEKVVVVPMRSGETYPAYIRNLTAFDGIAAVFLDFDLTDDIGSMSIETVLDYKAVREAVRFPAFLNIEGNLSESDAYTISTLSVQAVVLTASSDDETTREQIKAVLDLLEKVYPDDKEKDKDVPSLGRLTK